MSVEGVAGQNNTLLMASYLTVLLTLNDFPWIYAFRYPHLDICNIIQSREGIITTHMGALVAVWFTFHSTVDTLLSHFHPF